MSKTLFSGIYLRCIFVYFCEYSQGQALLLQKKKLKTSLFYFFVVYSVLTDNNIHRHA